MRSFYAFPFVADCFMADYKSSHQMKQVDFLKIGLLTWNTNVEASIFLWFGWFDAVVIKYGALTIFAEHVGDSFGQHIAELFVF